METNTNKAADYNNVLQYLATKQPAEWTPEQNVEKHFENGEVKIHYYHVRQALEFLKNEGYVEFSRNLNQYKITNDGRKFIADGGYKS